MDLCIDDIALRIKDVKHDSVTSAIRAPVTIIKLLEGDILGEKLTIGYFKNNILWFFDVILTI